MRSALVTGATGYLGSALVPALGALGMDVVALGSRDADLRLDGALAPYSHRRFDLVFHLAAWTEAGDFCLRHPGEQWLVNQRINTNVLAWWHAAQPQAKLVSIGTSCAYAEGSEHVESEYLLGEPTPSLYTYAMTKRMLWIGQQSLARQFGLRHMTVVPSTLYGPGYRIGHKQMHFVFDIAAKILARRRGGPRPVLWGTGEQVRELIYIDDFIGELLSLTPSVEGEIVNIGAGEGHSLREFADTICELAGVPPGDIVWDESRYVGARHKVLSTAKLDRLLPHRSRTPLRTGLARTLAWIEAGTPAVASLKAGGERR
jgi:GDP-L-fucose synthase